MNDGTMGESHPGRESRSGTALLWILTMTTGVVVAFLLRLRSSVDPDLWLHLRLGRTIRGGQWFGDLPDPLVELADRGYLPTQWLAEVGMDAVHGVTGVGGIHVVRVLALVALVAFVHLTARVQISKGRAAGVTLAVITGTATGWAERPQLIGLVLFAVTVWLWSRSRVHGGAPWTVVPLTWVWAMLHGSWVLGIATGALFVLAMVLERPRQARRWTQLIGVVIASAAVTALTPLGPRLLLEPFAVGGAAKGSVNEWLPPSPGNPLLWVVVIMAIGVVIGSMRQVGHRLPELLLAAAAVALAVTAVRTIAFGALLAAPALASVLAPRDEPVARVRRSEAWPLVALTALLLLIPGVVIAAPADGPLPRQVDAALGVAPAGTIAAVEPYSSGWVLWAHPHVRPLRDLRTEVYSGDTAAAYESFYRAEPGWQAYAADHAVTALVLVVGAPLDDAVAAEGGWDEVVRTDRHVLWQRVG